MRLYRRYRRFAWNAISRLLSYRANLLLFIFGSVLQTLVLYYLWRAVYLSAGKEVLHGFTFPEIFTYLVATLAVSALVRTNAEDTIADDILDGNIALALVRPVDYRLRIFSQSLGNAAYNLAFVFLPAAAVLAFFSIAGPPSGGGTSGSLAMGLAGGELTRHLGPFALTLVLAFLLNFFYLFCLGLVAFVTTNMWGVGRLEGVLSQLLTGGLIPLAFFPSWLAGAASLLPWASMGYVPVLALLGKLEGPALLRALALQAGWALFFIWLSGFLWKRLVRRLAVNGG